MHIVDSAEFRIAYERRFNSTPKNFRSNSARQFQTEAPLIF